MISRIRDRRRAAALQAALERYERLLADGLHPSQARSQAAADLGADARAFAIAATLPDAGQEVSPDPAFVRMFAARLRSEEMSRRPAIVLRPRFALAPLAAAACIAVFAALLVPSLSALPGDSFYALKGAREDARVWFATGPAEARVRLSLAKERFEEVEKLIDRSQLQAFVGRGGSVTLAAPSLDGINDPALVALIEDALAEAGRQIEAAAEIFIEHRVSSADLDDLVVLTQRGRELVSKVADELPTTGQPPVLDTGVKLAKIEAKANAARMNTQRPETTPAPCATPSPTPEPTGTPDADATVETATPTAVESPTTSPTATPEATPCTSPEPTLTPSPTPEPEATVAPLNEPTDAPERGEGVSDQSSEQEPQEPNVQGGAASDPETSDA